MKIKVNIDRQGYKSKPSKYAALISNRTRQAGATKEIEPRELIEYIKQGYTFTPGEIGGSIEEHKERQARNDTNLEPFWKSMQVIAIDIDNEQAHKRIPYELAPVAALDACKAKGIDPLCIYKTFSYTPEHQKYRVVILLEEPITDFNKAYEFIGKANNLFNIELAKVYKTMGLEPKTCVDSSIEPVKLIFGGRADCVIYTPETITPTPNRIIEGLETPTEAHKSASKEKTQKDTKKERRAYTGPTGGQNEQDLLIEALFAINPASLSYEEWRNIGMALKYEGISYDVFDQWNAQDTGTNSEGKARYNEQANFKSWQGFPEPGQTRGAGRNVTAATIFYFAKQNGCTYAKSSKREKFTPEEWAEIMQGFDPAPEQVNESDFPQEFFEDKKDQAPEKNETDTTENDAPGIDANMRSLEENMPPETNKNMNVEPATKTAPAPIESAAVYLSKQYDADITELKQYAGRKMGLHPDIDKYLTLYPGLAILGGQASLGKTTFCVNVAASLLAHGEHVLYFSLEQTQAEIMTKFAARYLYDKDKYTEIDNIRLKNGARDPETCEELAQMAEGLSNLYIIECDFETTAAEILATIENYMETSGVKPIVIIDYLQIIAPPYDFRGSKTEYIDENLKALKKWQKDNGLFILLISSFNRANNYEPVSYESFLYTSAIEFTCDFVFGLQLQILDPDNEDFYIKKGTQGGEYDLKSYEKKKKVQEAQSQTDPKKVQFVSLKNRNGKQLFKANFGYYPAHDYFTPDYTQAWGHPYKETFKNVL